MAEGGIDESRSQMRNATSFKEAMRQEGVKGGAKHVVKRVDRLIHGEPVDMLPPSVRKAADSATVDDFRAQMHNTSDTEGGKPLLWRRKGKELTPEFKNVYPKFESWWLAFAKRQMQLYPPEKYPFGPGEKSPVYPQWVMARSFYDGGQVKVAKIRAAFNDPQFFNTTMMFIEHEATLKMHAIAVAKEFQRTFESGKIISKNKVKGSLPDPEQLLAAGLELDTVLMLIALVGSATGFVPAALLSPVFMAGLQAATGMVGVAAIWELGKDGLKRLIDGMRKNGDIRVITEACANSLNEIKSQPGVMLHMSKVYGIKLDQITFNTGTGMPEFASGTTSNSWEAIQGDLNSDIRLREQFLTDLVKVDRKRAHALTEQFLTEGPRRNFLRQTTNRPLIVNQTGARYEEEVLIEFDHLRTVGWPEQGIAAGVPLDHSRQLDLQRLYMEASRRVLATKASAMFPPILEDIALNTMLVDGIEPKSKAVGNRRENLTRSKTDKDGKVTKEGIARAKLKEQATKAKERAQNLIDGAPADAGNPAKDGLSQMEKSISPTEPDGLFKRRELTGKAFADIVTELRARGYYKEATLIEQQNTFKNIDQAEKAIRKQKTELETVKLPQYAIGGAEEQQAETDRKNALTVINANPAAYAGKGGDAAREVAKQGVEQTKTARMTAIKEDRDRIKEQILDLEKLLSTIKQKREEVQSQFDTLSPLRPERVKIANIPEEMHAAYERVGTTGLAPGGIVIPDSHLSKYGQTGYLISDYVALPAFAAQRPPAGTLWAATEDDKFENQKIILLAVAEVKAKEIYLANTGKDLYAAPTPVQTEIIGVRGGVAGAITKEQLITLPTHRVRELLDAQAGALLAYHLLSPDQKLAQIKEIQNLETQRYVARQKALEVTKTAHNTVIAELTKAVDKVDEICDAQEETISLVEKFLEDRGNVYKEVRDMMTTESLSRYLRGSSVQADPTMTPNERASYCLAERQANMPRGFQDFLRDIFKYHELGRDLDKAEIAKMGSDKLYTVLINALGGPANAERNVANMIVDSFQPRIPPGEGFRRFVIPPGVDVHAMPFGQVIAILHYRNDPTGVLPTNALAIPYPDRLTTQDMMSIVENIAGTIAGRIAGSGNI